MKWFLLWLIKALLRCVVFSRSCLKKWRLLVSAWKERRMGNSGRKNKNSTWNIKNSVRDGLFLSFWHTDLHTEINHWWTVLGVWAGWFLCWFQKALSQVPGSETAHLEPERNWGSVDLHPYYQGHGYTARLVSARKLLPLSPVLWKDAMWLSCCVFIFYYCFLKYLSLKLGPISPQWKPEWLLAHQMHLCLFCSILPVEFFMWVLSSPATFSLPQPPQQYMLKVSLSLSPLPCGYALSVLSLRDSL